MAPPAALTNGALAPPGNTTTTASDSASVSQLTVTTLTSILQSIQLLTTTVTGIETDVRAMRSLPDDVNNIRLDIQRIRTDVFAVKSALSETASKDQVQKMELSVETLVLDGAAREADADRVNHRVTDIEDTLGITSPRPPLVVESGHMEAAGGSPV